MKTTITKTELQTGLSFTAGIAKNGMIPILANVLISKEGHNLSFVVADEGMQVRSVVATNTSEEFSFVVDYSRISAIASNLKDDAIISIDIEPEKILIKSGRSKFNIQTLPSSAFPFISNGEVVSKITIQQEEFKRLIASVQKSMATKDTRTQLNGLFFEVKDNVLSLVASDGMRLSANSIPLECDNVDRIIPAATVLRLAKALTSGEMSIEFSGQSVKFSINGNDIVSKVIDAKFPDYRRVIPSNHSQAITISKDSIIESCKRVSIPANEKFRGIRVEIGKTMNFSCSSGKETATDEFDIDYDGKPIEMGFNSDFLIDAASSIAGDTLTLSFNNDVPAAIMMMDESGLRAVVMPMKI